MSHCRKDQKRSILRQVVKTSHIGPTFLIDTKMLKTTAIFFQQPDNTFFSSQFGNVYEPIFSQIRVKKLKFSHF